MFDVSTIILNLILFINISAPTTGVLGFWDPVAICVIVSLVVNFQQGDLKKGVFRSVGLIVGDVHTGFDAIG